MEGGQNQNCSKFSDFERSHINRKMMVLVEFCSSRLEFTYKLFFHFSAKCLQKERLCQSGDAMQLAKLKSNTDPL